MSDFQLFVECGANTNSERFPFTRKHYMHPSESINFRNYYQNIGVYETVMQYINPVWMLNRKQRWVINARDSLKWGDLYLDFDIPLESDEDFNKIKSDVQIAMRYLKVILSIEPSQINLYYSGHKGIHVTVSGHVLGLTPHYSLNEVYKEIATDISNYTTFGTLDTRVYDDKRMFRMVNSYNKKGERYKVPLTYQELVNSSLEQVRQLAIKPRYIQPAPLIPSSKAKLSLDKYIQKWAQRHNVQKEFEGKIKKLERLPPCIQNMVDRTFRETIDERNNSGTALASFFMQQGMERAEAMVRLITWGAENCMPPLSKRDMEIIVNSVYDGQYRYGCEAFSKLSGVCDKANCPIFNKEANKKEEPASEE